MPEREILQNNILQVFPGTMLLMSPQWNQVTYIPQLISVEKIERINPSHKCKNLQYYDQIIF